MQNKKTKELTLLAILTALSVTFGFVAKIPTPTTRPRAFWQKLGITSAIEAPVPYINTEASA